MRICLAQTKPIAGDIHRNIENHKQLITLATSKKVDIIIFPELSLTGYEPTLVQELAKDRNDPRFNNFQEISNNHKITIGVGLPLKSKEDIHISMLLFHPNKAQQIYHKKYLHMDEDAFFVSAENSTNLIDGTNVAVAICYELSIANYAQTAVDNGAEVYLASVAKSADGVQQATKRLSEISTKYGMKTMMANSVGPCEGFDSDGKSSIWNENGLLLGQLNNKHEGLLILDTETNEVTTEQPDAN